jgi:cytochrome c oxidase subunit II
MLVVIGVVVGALTAAVAVFVDWLPDQASVQRERIDFVFWMTTWISVGIFALVTAILLYAVVKFRAPPDDDSDGPPIHGNTGLEIVWTAIPAILVIAIGVASAVVLWRNERVADDALVVRVTAQQFAWTFEYEDGPTTGRLGLPVNRDVVLRMNARDVIHSFWVPEFGQKQDTVPGMATQLVITPKKVGTYPVICTELCGLGHALMRTFAIVMEPEEFDAWLADEAERGAGGRPAGGDGDQDGDG